MKRVSALWWTVMAAFAIGEIIILATLAVCQTLYVSDPLTICLLVGGISLAIALLVSGFTVRESTVTYSEFARYAAGAEHKDTTSQVVKPIFRDNARPPLDTDPVDITAEDEAVRKEDAHALQRQARKGKHEAPSKA